MSKISEMPNSFEGRSGHTEDQIEAKIDDQAKKRLLSYLGLCMKAGMLKTGEEAIKSAIRSGLAQLVVVAADASDNSKKMYADKCAFYRIPLKVLLDRDDISRAIGKPNRPAVAIVDGGFAKAMLALL